MVLPALFKPGAKTHKILGQDVKLRPRFTYDSPDWDLAFRIFYDMAITEITDPLTGEFDQDLASAGIGLDFKYKRYINMRLDWGYVLEDLKTFAGDAPEQEAGDSRVHFSLTVIF